MEVSPSRSLGSFEPFAWRMNVRLMPSAPPNSPASNTTLSRGDAWPDWDASVVVQSSWANTNAAKSTSWESSTSRSRVDRPGLNVVVQGSTSATSSSPRVIAWTSLACLPDDPRKMRGLFMRDSPFRSRDEGQSTRLDPVRDEVERRSALHLQRLARMASEDEDGMVVGRIFSPPALPRLVPRSRAAAEHVPAHDCRAGAAEDVLGERRARVDLAAFLPRALADALGAAPPADG